MLSLVQAAEEEEAAEQLLLVQRSRGTKRGGFQPWRGHLAGPAETRQDPSAGPHQDNSRSRGFDLRPRVRSSAKHGLLKSMALHHFLPFSEPLICCLEVLPCSCLTASSPLDQRPWTTACTKCKVTALLSSVKLQGPYKSKPVANISSAMYSCKKRRTAMLNI